MQRQLVQTSTNQQAMALKFVQKLTLCTTVQRATIVDEAVSNLDLVSDFAVSHQQMRPGIITSMAPKRGSPKVVDPRRYFFWGFRADFLANCGLFVALKTASSSMQRQIVYLADVFPGATFRALPYMNRLSTSF